MSVASYIRQRQTVRQSAGQDNVGHSEEILVSVIPENKDARLLARAGFFFGQHNVAIAVAIEVGSVDRAFTAGEHVRH